MKKEVRQFREKAISSLILSIEHFNKPWDRGRIESVLILLDHSFEMLLKSSILHKNGKIREPRKTHTIGFDACVRKSLTDAKIKIITDEQALTLQAIHGLRNATQHDLVDISEHQLYFYSQTGVTLFRDIHDKLFNKKLVLELPERVLPVSTTAPKDLSALFDKETNEIRQLLTPGTRKRMDAISKVRSLSVLENAVNSDYEQPSKGYLNKVCKRLAAGDEWPSIFPGVASINITTETDGLKLNLRLTKREGTPVHIIKEGQGQGAVVALRKINETDFYSLGALDLAKKVGLTEPKCRAIIDHLGLKGDAEFFKEIRIGKTVHRRYSHKAIPKIKHVTENESVDAIWRVYKAKTKR